MKGKRERGERDAEEETEGELKEGERSNLLG